MNKIKVLLIYPSGFSIETKNLLLNELELNVLLNSKKVGSEGRYFLIDEIIFEDNENNYFATVVLK